MPTDETKGPILPIVVSALYFYPLKSCAWYSSGGCRDKPKRYLWGSSIDGCRLGRSVYYAA